MSSDGRAIVGSGAGQPAPDRGVPGPVAGDHRRAFALLAVPLRGLGILLLAISLLIGSAPFSQPSARAASPRVAIIVGPVGGLTDLYRSDARRAAAEARRYTDDVVTVYSPNATWTAARAAMQGASIVVYLGHGNGFPSPYGRTLNPRTQNGLGLNPVAGRGDATHQYFGEWYLRRQVRLAPNAVVILSHLCYASGNAEPGLAEGTLAMSRQRVDNFAAGFLAAGAAAVIADGHLGPAYYVRSILAGRGTVEGIWRSAPNFHDHVIAFPSERTPGLTALLDPTRPRSEFYRSLVAKAELRAEEVARGASLRATTPDPAATAAPPRVAPSVEKVGLRGRAVAGGTIELAVSLADPGSLPVADLGVGVRWTPLDVAPATLPGRQAAGASATAPAGSPAAPGATPAANAPGATPAANAPGDPVATAPAPVAPVPVAASIAPAPDPRRGLVAAEAPGAIVKLADVRAGARGLRASLDVPLVPGLYRLATTLHDGDGVAFEAAAQERIPALLVRVTAPLSARISAATEIATVTGASIVLPVAVLNSGSVAWSDGAVAAEREDDETGVTPASPDAATLVGHWVRVEPVGGAPDLDPVRATVDAAPGKVERVNLRLAAPDLPGTYLLLLDVVSPRHGSLAGAGGEPFAVRVRVAWPAPAPDASAAPDVSPAPDGVTVPDAVSMPDGVTAPDATPSSSAAPAPDAPSVSPSVPAQPSPTAGPAS